MDALTPHFAAWKQMRAGNREIVEGLVRAESRGPVPELAEALAAWPGQWYWADSPRTRVVLVRPLGMSALAWGRHVALFALTLLCAMGAGAVLLGSWTPRGGEGLLGALTAALDYFVSLGFGAWRSILPGWAFAVPLLLILLVHELGHYLAARRYGIDATPPYFIPVPPTLSPIGSLGAFIRLRSPVVDRRQLLDVGAAGPLAGFLVALLVLAWGYSISERIPILIGSDPSYITLAGQRVFLGESLLTGWLRDLIVPGSAPLHLSAPAFAGWVGMFITGINLIPLSQFDGGHVVYAVLGKHQRWAAWLAVAAMLWLAQQSPMWYAWLVLSFLVGRGSVLHPPVLIERQGLPRSRWVVGLLALILFAVTLVPRPFG